MLGRRRQGGRSEKLGVGSSVELVAQDWCSGGGDKVDAAKSLAWEALPNWWLKTGSSIFPDVALVFQALLAMPGGAASLERDFSIASNVLTVHRAQLDQAYVEMTMLLHMSMDKIPPFPQIMELSSTDAHAALPRRLRNKEDFVKSLPPSLPPQTNEERSAYPPRG